MTPFMVRVTEALAGTAEPGQPAVKASQPKPTPEGVDEQIGLRLVAEQLVSEANAVLAGRAERIDLIDQPGDGRLGFSMRFRARRAIVRTRFDAGRAVAELQGIDARRAGRVELAGPTELESLIVWLLCGGG